MISCIYHDGHTVIADGLDGSLLDPGGLFIFARDPTEDRTHVPCWDGLLLTHPEQCVQVVRYTERSVDLKCGAIERSYLLTDLPRLTSILSRPTAYVDITGLAHHVWAPLVRAAIGTVEELHVVYMEPERYREQTAPSPTSLYDLTEAFRGIEPLPGFVNLRGAPIGASTVFVPFLGFEGARAKYVASSLESVSRIVPIVGVPGFRFDYPQITVASNRDFLEESNSYTAIRFAKASCPFDAYTQLAEVRRDNPGSHIYVAPIGTKPHALGAVLFAIDNASDCELIYDNPIRRQGRTKGIGKAHVYCVKPRDAYDRP